MSNTRDERGSTARAAKVAREIAEHVGRRVDASQIRTMANVARTQDREVLDFVERFLTVVRVKSVRRGAIVAGLTEAMKVVSETPSEDPLGAVDDPMRGTEASEVVAVAAGQEAEVRGALLRATLAAADAARLTRRSRQSLERFRRAGHVVALREGNQWRYPRWQFDPDAPGGIVPGLRQVLGALRLSPAGAAYWLSRRHPRLRAAPIRLLRSGRVDDVVAVARAVGERI